MGISENKNIEICPFQIWESFQRSREYNKKLIFKKNFCFPKFPLFNPLASFDLNLLEKGWAKYFKNGLKSFHISHPSICTVYLFWGRTLIQMSSPDRGDKSNLSQPEMDSSHPDAIVPQDWCTFDKYKDLHYRPNFSLFGWKMTAKSRKMCEIGAHFLLIQIGLL